MFKTLIVIVVLGFLLSCLTPSALAVTKNNLDGYQLTEEQIITDQAQVAVMAESDPRQLALAMDMDATSIVTASIGMSDERAFAIANLSPSNAIMGGTFALISTGKAAAINAPNKETNLTTILKGLNNADGTDLVQLSIQVHVPKGANCATVNFAFFTEEYSEFQSTYYRDAFTAEVGGTNLEIVGDEVSSALNFAHTKDGRVISTNTQNEQFNVTTNVGTTYDGASPLLTIQTPVTPSTSTEFVFSIQDVGDSVYDSTVLLDNFRFIQSNECLAGIFVGTPTDLPSTDEPSRRTVYLPLVAR